MNFIKRDLIPPELEQVKKGFDRHAIEHDVLVQSADRFSYVAKDGDIFMGCSSGLPY